MSGKQLTVKKSKKMTSTRSRKSARSAPRRAKTAAHTPTNKKLKHSETGSSVDELSQYANVPMPPAKSVAVSYKIVGRLQPLAYDLDE